MIPLSLTGCDGYDTSFCGGINMEAMWDAFFWMIPFWVFFFVPFSTFYYEADDGMLMAGTSVDPNPVKKSKIRTALVWEVAVIFVIFILFLVTYLLFSEATIPVDDYLVGSAREADEVDDVGTVFFWEPITNATNETEILPFDSSYLHNMIKADNDYADLQEGPGDDTITLQVSVSTFFGGLMAWIGWFFFALFGGIGLAALPLDLINTFRHRPRHMDATEFAEAQVSLRERVNELVDIGELIKVEQDANPEMGSVGGIGGFFNSEKRAEAKQERQALLEFKQAVYLLEQDVEEFQACSDNYDNYNPLKPYFGLVFGVCSAIISLFWFLHIIVYMFPSKPLAPFLNNYFEWFDRWFPLFGVLSVAIFTVYLLFCAVKGCFKFGLRVACIQLHPMIMGKTYMSSLMFNIGLVLLCSLPVVQFCSEAFADYARFSTARQIFGVQIYNLKFFGWWWSSNIFVYIFFALSILSSIYLWCVRPKDAPPNAAELRDKLRSRRS